MQATPKELRDAFQINAEKRSTEAAQRDSVVRDLAALGYRTPPKVTSGRLDGSTIRLYCWAGSPAGDLILAAGPSFIPKVLAASDIQQERPGVYILSSTDTTKAASRAAATAERWQPRAPKALARATPPVKARIAKSMAKVAERIEEAPVHSARDVDAADREELKRGLAALFG